MIIPFTLKEIHSQCLFFKDGKSIKKQLLHSCMRWLTITLITLALLWLASVLDDVLGHFFAIILYVLLISLPFVVTVSTLLFRRCALSQNVGVKSPKRNGAAVGSIAGSSGSFLGVMLIILFPPSTHVATAILLLVLAVFIAVTFSVLTVSFFYRLYLLLKYCPEIADNENIEELRRATMALNCTELTKTRTKSK